MTSRAVIEYIYPGIPTTHYRLEQRGALVEIAMWSYAQPQPTAQQMADAELPASKAVKIAAINAECRSRLLARFGDPAEQVSRSLGIYGATEKTAMEAGISATIDASNVASNAVLAATTVAEVEAVTVAWPVI